MDCCWHKENPRGRRWGWVRTLHAAEQCAQAVSVSHEVSWTVCDIEGRVAINHKGGFCT
jgi:hypothetical protein